MDTTIAVLGATGRTGRGIAKAVHAAGHTVVLVGRDSARLGTLSAELPGSRVIAAEFEAALMLAAKENVSIVVNTVGPFERTAPQVLDALPSADYVDLANDPIAFGLVLDRSDAARESGRTLVTGAGFGVLATEAAALRVRGDRPAPTSVRVDAMAAIAGDGGAMGEALAATIIDGIGSMARIPARRRRDWPGFGARRERVVTPDGDELLTVGFPSGEFLAARSATGATSVFSASSELPTSRIVPMMLPVALLALRSARLRRTLVARMARIELPESTVTRSSWGRARAEWPDGTQRTVWLRVGEGMEFTIAVAAEVALRVARGEGTPGAFTPGQLFGTELAEAAGGTFVD